ncbi:MAG: hypothetical protein HGA39_05610 [Coriobacteriia bacterium]|nr:hypothetical protein [Coriobacteriia bacterium]
MLQWITNYLTQDADSEDKEAEVTLALTYPVGRSPKVFVSGWVFGASCVIDGKDYSDQVKWSGTGTFGPEVGARSRPVFNGPGSNTITLSVTVNGKTTSKSFSVEAVSSEGYACVGMLAYCPADAHGDPGDPHPVTGPITSGSSNVFINGKAAARVGDTGVHAACSGPNTFTIAGGDSEVLINGKPAAKIGSTTRHCGGTGTIVGFRE